jgi:hypothetical protein
MRNGSNHKNARAAGLRSEKVSVLGIDSARHPDFIFWFGFFRRACIEFQA